MSIWFLSLTHLFSQHTWCVSLHTHTYVSCPFSGCSPVPRKSWSMCCDCEDMTSLFVLYREVLSPSINTDSPPVDSFLVTVQCHIPRHKVPHFQVKVLKRWGGSGDTRTGTSSLSTLKPQLEDGEHLLGIQPEDECTAPEQSRIQTGFTLSRVITVQAYKLLKCYFISLSYMSFHTFYRLIKPLF